MFVFTPIYQTTFESKQVKIEFCVCNKEIDNKEIQLAADISQRSKCRSLFLQTLPVLLPPQMNNAATSKSRISESEDQRTNSILKV